MTLDYTPEFKRAVRKLSRRYRSLRSDLQSLLDQLDTGETPGDQLQNTHYPTYKVRVQNSDARRGKSGGYRVIYYIRHIEKTVLVTVYSKSDQEDMPSEEVRRIIAKYDVQESNS